MSGCSAAIRVGGGQRVVCNDHNPFGDGPSTHQYVGEFVLSWTDDSFGAYPHHPPEPRYYLEWSQAGRSWRLINRGSRLDVPGAPPGTIASFYGAQGQILAEDVLDRLNREDVR